MMFKYGIDVLTVDKVISIAQGKLAAKLTKEAIKKVKDCRSKVENMANGSKAANHANMEFQLAL